MIRILRTIKEEAEFVIMVCWVVIGLAVVGGLAIAGEMTHQERLDTIEARIQRLEERCR